MNESLPEEDSCTVRGGNRRDDLLSDVENRLHRWLAPKEWSDGYAFLKRDGGSSLKIRFLISDPA